MALPLVKIKYEGSALYSPFSGQPTDAEGLNEEDPTILFIYYGNAGQLAFVSDRVIEAAKLDPADCPDGLELSPTQLIKRLTFAAGFAMEVDAGWNGVNYYGFAPEEE